MLINPSSLLNLLLKPLFPRALRWLAVPLLCVGAAVVHAQAGPAKGVQLVQRIDDVLVGVDPISLAVIDNRYVTGVAVRVNVNVAGALPAAPLAYSHFLADCHSPMRFAVVSTAATPFDLTPQGSSFRARYDAARAALVGSAFAPVGMLDGSRAVATFACKASLSPSGATQIARDLFQQGGPADMRSALCDLRPDGALETREDVEVRFSDSEKVVAVQQQWMSTGKVTDTEISFGSGPARWRIDRNTAEATSATASTSTISKCSRSGVGFKPLLMTPAALHAAGVIIFIWRRSQRFYLY